ncbi:MAG: hypothetical protein WB053_13115 [Nitrososphaeraceae archaeon]
MNIRDGQLTKTKCVKPKGDSTLPNGKPSITEEVDQNNGYSRRLLTLQIFL